MIDAKTAGRIAQEYLEQSGYTHCQISDIKDKIYKWLVDSNTKEGRIHVEVSKSSNLVLKLTKIE